MPSSPQIAVISSSVDVLFATRLIDDLETAGFNVLDITKADIGEPEKHLAHLEAAHHYLIVLSVEGARSAWLQNEITRVCQLTENDAAQQILPIVLAPLNLPDALRGLALADFASVPYEQAIAQLQQRLLAALADDGFGSSLPAPQTDGGDATCDASEAEAPSPPPAPQPTQQAAAPHPAPPGAPQMAPPPPPAAMAPEATPPDLGPSRFLQRGATAPMPAVSAEDVAFTAYHPREVAPRQWQALLVYIASDTPAALAGVAADAETRLAIRRDAYRETTTRARTKLKRGAPLTLIPSLPGFEFNPSALRVKWEEDVQRHEFRVRATDARPGQAVNGSIQIFSGPFLRGELPLSIFVQDADAEHKSAGGFISVFARGYRRIFASYSHADTPIVQSCASAAKAIGDRYLMDITLLHSGEAWDERLLQAIDEADVFQLFWSERAATSPAVEKEWRHALRLAGTRPGFVRPVYWSAKPYRIPPELSAIHFDRLDAGRLGAGRVRTLLSRLFRRG